MARKRAQQRWSALLARIAKQVRPMLGALWICFVKHAETSYRADFISAFRVSRLHCAGPPHGAPCPISFCVDLTSASAFATLDKMHLDHEQDVVVTCDMWVNALASLPGAPRTWDDGINADLLCHLLFGVESNQTHGAPMLRFRCGPGAARCHKLNMPHYRGLRDVSSARQPA